jgi:hypothetical protein
MGVQPGYVPQPAQGYAPHTQQPGIYAAQPGYAAVAPQAGFGGVLPPQQQQQLGGFAGSPTFGGFGAAAPGAFPVRLCKVGHLVPI